MMYSSLSTCFNMVVPNYFQFISWNVCLNNLQDKKQIPKTTDVQAITHQQHGNDILSGQIQYHGLSIKVIHQNFFMHDCYFAYLVLKPQKVKESCWFNPYMYPITLI